LVELQVYLVTTVGAAAALRRLSAAGRLECLELGAESSCVITACIMLSRVPPGWAKLKTRHFNTGTRGFAAPEDTTTAVCVLPGTELAFADKVRAESGWGWFSWRVRTINYTTAVFRQINKHEPRTHHDALEFPDWQIALLTDVFEDQEATVLQLPAQAATPSGVEAQRRVAHFG
jgi:hypothetical protein